MPQQYGHGSFNAGIQYDADAYTERFPSFP